MNLRKYRMTTAFLVYNDEPKIYSALERMNKIRTWVFGIPSIWD